MVNPKGLNVLMALPSVICAVAIAACGSSGHKPNASSRAQSFLAFSECMRSHRVTAFPDPQPSGGINLGGTGINPASPAFEAAQAACRKLLPVDGPSAHASEQQKQQMFATSVCMRSHGVSGFPDPTERTTPTAPPTASDLWLLVPSTINVNSPAFTKAAKACNLSLIGRIGS
jgi:hypothetical protein